MGSFGDRLKKEREQRGISLEDIALTTKIGTRLLRALEDEKFDQLPGGIFNKGFVRAYARHVGIDVEQAVADYVAALGENQLKVADDALPLPPPAARVRESMPDPRIPVVRESRRRDAAAEIPWGLLAILLLLIALAFASWSYYHREQRVETHQSAVPLPVPAPSTAGTLPSANSQGPSQTSQPGTATNPVSSTAIEPEPQPTSQTTPVAQAVPQSSAPTPTVIADSFTVSLKGNEESEECWVSVSLDGKPPVEAILVAPSEKTFRARSEIVVRAGNVGALDVFFNGRKLPSQGEYGTVKILTFHPQGLQPPPPKPSAPTQ
jgi:cytoskeleton protein RodZ